MQPRDAYDPNSEPTGGGAGWPGSDPSTGRVAFDVDTAAFSPVGGISFMEIGDEIILASFDGTKRSVIKRGCFGTSVEAHDTGDAWREVVPIIGYDATILEQRWSKFTMGDSPEEILLQLLCGSGTYGVLPSSWNAGIDPARIDVAGFLALRDSVHPNERLCGIVRESISFTDLVTEHILKPFGLYLVHGNDDVIRLRHLRQRAAPAGALTIDSSTLIEPPSWSSGFDKVVGQYRLEADLMADDKVGTAYADFFTDTIALYGNRARTVTHRSIFVHDRAGPCEPTGAYRQAQRVFDRRRGYLLSRYGLPPPVVHAKVLMSALGTEPGDTVNVNLPGVPSMTGAGRGYVGIAEVLSKKPDDAAAAVEFDLLILGTGLSGYGAISPSAEVTAKAATTVTLAANRFTDAPDVDSAHFSAGDAVLFVSADFGTTAGPVLLTGVAGNVLSMAAVPAAVAAGWFVTWANYDSLSAAQKAKRRVSMADSAERLGAANDQPFRYAGG